MQTKANAAAREMETFVLRIIQTLYIISNSRAQAIEYRIEARVKSDAKNIHEWPLAMSLCPSHTFVAGNDTPFSVSHSVSQSNNPLYGSAKIWEHGMAYGTHMYNNNTRHLMCPRHVQFARTQPKYLHIL